jgi:hypothetical protein
MGHPAFVGGAGFEARLAPRWLIFKMSGCGDVRAEARTLQSDERQTQIPFGVAQGRLSAAHPIDKLRVRSLRMTEILEIRGIPGLKIESSPQRRRPVAGDPETWGTQQSSGAKARVVFCGFMRGFKPPPPSDFDGFMRGLKPPSSTPATRTRRFSPTSKNRSSGTPNRWGPRPPSGSSGIPFLHAEARG